MRPGVRRDARFYVNFGETHKYRDGTRSGEAPFGCSELLRLDLDQPLDGGMDFGNMLSLVIAQRRGEEYCIHRNFYTLPPDSYRELADRFLDFFADHRAKVLHLFYDRAGNNMQAQREDQASKIKRAIEIDGDGNRTGWTVRLMSRNQKTIYQHEEYDFMMEILGESNPRLPKVRIDALGCVEMISSIELAKAEVKYRNDRRVVAKVKKSEKLALRKLPKLSTNFSDAFKYLLMRRSWLEAAKARSGSSGSGGASSASEWLKNR